MKTTLPSLNGYIDFIVEVCHVGEAESTELVKNNKNKLAITKKRTIIMHPVQSGKALRLL